MIAHPLVPRDNITFSPLHIKLGLMKQSAKAFNKDGKMFWVLVLYFSRHFYRNKKNFWKTTRSLVTITLEVPQRFFECIIINYHRASFALPLVLQHFYEAFLWFSKNCQFYLVFRCAALFITIDFPWNKYTFVSVVTQTDPNGNLAQFLFLNLLWLLLEWKLICC